MKIDVLLEMSHGPRRVVSGEIVDVAPHLAHLATFVVHESQFGLWQISNVESGHRAGLCYETKKATINAARRFLSDITERKLLNAYKRAKVK